MDFKPLGKRVLVLRTQEETKTASGIIIPDNAKEKPLSGTIKSISNKVQEAGELSVNDTIVFGKYAGTEITLDNKEYLVLETKDILGINK
jgi:chaperonin GroES